MFFTSKSYINISKSSNCENERSNVQVVNNTHTWIFQVKNIQLFHVFALFFLNTQTILLFNVSHVLFNGSLINGKTAKVFATIVTNDWGTALSLPKTHETSTILISIFIMSL